MSLSDYVRNNMTTEGTELFLKMKGERLEDFVPVMLEGSSYDDMDDPDDGRDIADRVLEWLGEQAKDLHCKYVTNVHPFGYHRHSVVKQYTDDSGDNYQATAFWTQELYLVGTGLVAKVSEAETSK
jgi:hypothetical protein